MKSTHVKIKTGPNEKGIVFIGVAVSLPLIIISLFFLLYIGQYILAQSSLRHAVFVGSRFGSTRGKESLVWRDGSGILGEIRNYRAGGAMPQSLFTPGEDQGNYTQILEILGEYPVGTTLTQMQPEILLAMITSYESIKQRLSNDVRYPCSVSDTGGTRPLLTEPGCLACFPRNPDGEAGIFDPTARDFTTIACVYTPSNLFVRPIISMFQLLGMNTQKWTYLTAETTSRIDGGLMCPDDQNCLIGGP